MSKIIRRGVLFAGGESSKYGPNFIKGLQLSAITLPNSNLVIPYTGRAAVPVASGVYSQGIYMFSFFRYGNYPSYCTIIRLNTTGSQIADILLTNDSTLTAVSYNGGSIMNFAGSSINVSNAYYYIVHKITIKDNPSDLATVADFVSTMNIVKVCSPTRTNYSEGGRYGFYMNTTVAEENYYCFACFRNIHVEDYTDSSEFCISQIKNTSVTELTGTTSRAYYKMNYVVGSGSYTLKCISTVGAGAEAATADMLPNGLMFFTLS